jgi:hypothetical protein
VLLLLLLLMALEAARQHTHWQLLEKEPLLLMCAAAVLAMLTAVFSRLGAE